MALLRSQGAADTWSIPKEGRDLQSPSGDVISNHLVTSEDIESRRLMKRQKQLLLSES